MSGRLDNQSLMKDITYFHISGIVQGYKIFIFNPQRDLPCGDTTICLQTIVSFRNNELVFISAFCLC